MNNKSNLVISKSLIIISTTLGFAACNGGSTTPSNLSSNSSALQLSNFSTSDILSNGRGELATATVSLNGFRSVNNLQVNFTPSNSSVTVSPESCVLSTSNSSCTITVTGESVSPAVTITASASGYASITSMPVKVYSQITPTLTNPVVGVTTTYSINGTQVSFSGAINPASLSNTTFIVSTSLGSPSGESGTFTTDSGESVVIFKPTPHFNFNAPYYITTTSGITDSYSQPVESLAHNSFLTQESLEIYVATNNGNGWNGNLLSAGQAINQGVTTGIQGADALCQADSQCPVGSMCKAILVDMAGNRVAAPESHDWVLQPSMTYMNESGYFIGTTAESSVFTFNLINPFSGYTTPLFIWTGLNGDWTTLSAKTCNSWSSSSGSLSGQVGITGVIGESSISFGSTFCNPSFKEGLYCVQQP